jgi:hypothetical protein
MTAFFHSATLFATPPNGSHDEEVNVTTGKEFALTGPDGLPVSLHDVVVSAVRRR